MNFFSFLQNPNQILGLNGRNISYLRPSNTRKSRRVADNKLLSKKILKKHGLPVLETFSIVKDAREVRNFDWTSLPKSFALKPNRGLAGEGILIVYGQKKKPPYPWVKADKKEIHIRDLESHVSNILEGNYSLTSLSDIAFFEERAKLLKLFKAYSYRGIPDIRIIVYNLVPVMAELRLPTRESGGKANLHLGAIGVGIDMGTGVTTSAIQRDRLIEHAPETRLPLSGIHIPGWKDVLRLAIEAQRVTNIGFMGIDVAIDREKGPVVLELNARPGLSIQIANLSPLNERLKRIKGLKVKSVAKGVNIAQDLFGGEIEEELEEMSGRRVIGINEPTEIMDSEGNKHQVVAKIDTGAYRTTACTSLADKLAINKPIGYKKVRSAIGAHEWPIISLSFVLDKRLVNTEAFVADRKEMKYDIVIGRRDLKRFLVDPAKNVFMGKTRKTI